jgi:hypothetical protein
MDIYFDYLKQLGLTKETAKDKLLQMKDAEIREFIDQSNTRIPFDNRRSISIFDYIANSQLSGEPTPCINLECRLKHLNNLMRIAVLYSDRVLIKNPFSKYSGQTKFNKIARKIISGDIVVLYSLKPLLDCQIVGICNSDLHFCKDCYENIILSSNSNLEYRVKDIRNILTNNYLQECKFTYYPKKKAPYVVIDGPEHIDHSSVIVCESIPQKYKSLVNPKILNNTQIKDFNIVNHLVDEVINDIVLQNWFSNLNGTNYLTDRTIDFSILSAINDEITNIDSKKINKALSHTVPFLSGIDINTLIKLRFDEGESFKVYRDTFNSLINEYSNLELKLLKEAFNDIINPELNKIDQTINNTKKISYKKLTKDLLVGSCFIGIGLFSGILPSNIGAIVAALGGFNYASKISDDIYDLINSSDKIRDNKFYFLWKIKETMKK